MPFTFAPMTAAYADTVITWRYAAPYDFYNTPSEDTAAGIASVLEPNYHYYVLLDDGGALVAFCCFGDDAQVPGGDYHAAAIDIGVGMRPDLTGQGNGSAYFAAICDFARHQWQPVRLRLTVAAFNQRALRLYEKAGFHQVQEFRREGDGVAFLVLTLTL